MNLSDKNLLDELVIESREHSDSIEPDLLAMENSQNVPKETINRIFRAIHSIKGGFSFFGMENIKALSHAMETMMMDMAYTQVAKSIGLPTHAYMGLSDAKCVDAQAGLETGIGAVLAALAGVKPPSTGLVGLPGHQKGEFKSIRMGLRAVDAPRVLSSLRDSRG